MCEAPGAWMFSGSWSMQNWWMDAVTFGGSSAPAGRRTMSARLAAVWPAFRTSGDHQKALRRPPAPSEWLPNGGGTVLTQGFLFLVPHATEGPDTRRGREKNKKPRKTKTKSWPTLWLGRREDGWRKVALAGAVSGWWPSCLVRST